MTRIIISNPGSPSTPVLYTDCSDILIKDAFLGVKFETAEGEELSVSMRDGGFEVTYSADFGENGFDRGISEFKNGKIKFSRGSIV